MRLKKLVKDSNCLLIFNLDNRLFFVYNKFYSPDSSVGRAVD